MEACAWPPRPAYMTIRSPDAQWSLKPPLSPVRCDGTDLQKTCTSSPKLRLFGKGVPCQAFLPCGFPRTIGCWDGRKMKREKASWGWVMLEAPLAVCCRPETCGHGVLLRKGEGLSHGLFILCPSSLIQSSQPRREIFLAAFSKQRN